MLRRLSFALCLTSAVLTLGGAAAGDGGPARPSSASVPADLADDVRRGDRARLLGRWSDAAAAYAEALATAERAGVPEGKRAAILGELGAAEVALEKYRDGAEHLYRSLVYSEGLTSEQRRRYEDARGRAAREIAIVVVAVNPSDAELRIDDTPIPERRSAHVLFVEPGQHTLRARLDGYRDSVVRHNAPKGSEAALALTLVEQPSMPAPAARPHETAGPAAKPRAPGPSGASTASDMRTLGFVVAGLGAAAGVGMLIATVPINDAIQDGAERFNANADHSACREPTNAPPECLVQQARVRERAWLSGAGWVAIGTSAMIATVAATSYLWADAKEKERDVRVCPLVNGQHAGVVVLGQW